MHAATSRISASAKPRVVTAGLPSRMPLGFSGGLTSNGMRVLVDRDARAVERVFGFLAAHAFREDVDQQQVRVGAAGNDAEAFGLHARRERLRVGDHLPLVID